MAQIQGDGGQWGASREEGEESPAASQGLPPQVGLTPFCTDVLSEGLGSGARISKTEDTPAGGREGGEVDLRKRRRVMLAELYKLHSGLKDKQLRVRGRVALLSITIAL